MAGACLWRGGGGYVVDGGETEMDDVDEPTRHYILSDEPQTNKQRLQISLNRSHSQHILRARTIRLAVDKFN